MRCGIRYFFTALVALSSFNAVSASNTSLAEIAKQSLPSCAFKCLSTAVSQLPCSPDDLACVCTNRAFSEQMEFCVSLNCTIKESLVTKNFTSTACHAPVRDRTRSISWVGVGGAILAMVAVLLRLAQRLPVLGGKFGMDDVFIIASTVVMIPLSVLSAFLAKAGLGKDIWTVSFSNITRILYIYYFDEMMYVTSLALTKVSILAFYLRVFQTRNFRYMAYFLMACHGAYIIAFDLAFMLQCRPLKGAWNRWDGEHEGSCVNANAIVKAAAAFNIILDVFTIILPQAQIAKLQLSWGKKIPLMVVFALGIFVTIISCLRIKFLSQFANSDNVTWDYVPIGYWSTVEVHLSIILACTPSIRALIIRFFPNFSFATVNSYASGSRSRSKLSEANTRSGSRLSALQGPKNNFLPLEEFDDRVKNAPMTSIRVDKAFDMETYERSQRYMESQRFPQPPKPSQPQGLPESRGYPRRL